MIRRNRGSNQTDFKVKKKLNERTLKQEQKEGTSKTFLRSVTRSSRLRQNYPDGPYSYQGSLGRRPHRRPGSLSPSFRFL